MAEDYELMPHQTIVNIKHELENLKKKAGSMQEISSKEFKESIDKLNSKINSLLNLFTEAAKGMQKEDEESSSLVERMNVLEDENRKIAEGILVVADMIKELQKTREPEKTIPPKMPSPKPMSSQMPVQRQLPPQQERPMPRPVFRQMPPQMEQSRPMPPNMMERPSMSPMQQRYSMPPEPQRVIPRPMPPQGGYPQMGPTPLPEISAPEKEGFISKIFKKR